LNPALLRTSATPEAAVVERPLDFENVYRTHGMAVARWAARLGGPKVDPEDIVQEVFLKVREELPRFQDSGRLEGWLYRMTFNEVRYRRRKNRLWGWLAGTAEESGRDVAASERDAAEKLEHREGVQRLYAALDRVNDKYRQVLVLHLFEERGGEEIAGLMGARVETVWVWLHRARAALARELHALEERPT
jgi:RNA polymerase sigma-70 factor (ECF subfamily)